ncbi:MAG: MgtC/SapB family protein [Vicinamibacterales bacterium]
MSDLTTLLDLIVATIGGAAIGVERQWSGHASGQDARFAGVRTFTLIGAVAGTAGWLAQTGQHVLALALVAGPIALTVVAYSAASRRDVDATTEVAAFVAISAGLLAGLGHRAIASGMIALTVLLLLEKTRLHALVSHLNDRELQAAARFAVMAVVILPLLPEGPFGPLGGVRPRELWLLVLFFSALSFAGYLARRLVGPEHGYPVTGALAGLVSSTNATYAFARLSRVRPLSSAALAAGALAACTVLFPRVLLATTVLEPRVAWALMPYVAVPFGLGVLIMLFWLQRIPAVDEADGVPANPLQVWPALQMAATFQVVLFGVALVQDTFGSAGLMASGAVLGLTDVDALTISMSKSVAGGVTPDTAARAIAVGILSNCAMKSAIAALLGTRGFGRRAGGALIGMALVLAAAITLTR